MIRLTDGGTGMLLDDAELERMVRGAVDAASGGVLEVLRPLCDTVAAGARAQWYTLVNRDTGLSGDIRVVETVTPTQVVVSTGSTDTRRAHAKVGTFPLPEVVGMAGPGSKRRRKQPAGAPIPAGATVAYRAKGYVYVDMPNPKASAAPFTLLPRLVRRPIEEAVRGPLAPKLSEAVARRLRGGRG